MTRRINTFIILSSLVLLIASSSGCGILGLISCFIKKGDSGPVPEDKWRASSDVAIPVLMTTDSEATKAGLVGRDLRLEFKPNAQLSDAGHQFLLRARRLGGHLASNLVITTRSVKEGVEQSCTTQFDLKPTNEGELVLMVAVIEVPGITTKCRETFGSEYSSCSEENEVVRRIKCDEIAVTKSVKRVVYQKKSQLVASGMKALNVHKYELVARTPVCTALPAGEKFQHVVVAGKYYAVPLVDGEVPPVPSTAPKSETKTNSVETSDKDAQQKPRP